MKPSVAALRERLGAAGGGSPLGGVRRTTAVRTAVIVTAIGAGWLLLHLVLPRGLPPGIVLFGAVIGSLTALSAIGVVLIYRANQVVNFAQAELGVVGAILAIELNKVLNVNFFLAVATGLVAGALTGALIDLGVVRVFRQAPRLILAVATIGVAQALNGISILIPIWFTGGVGDIQTGFDTPLQAGFYLSPRIFSGNEIAAMITVPILLIGLTAFLRFTDYGVAIRAAAENGDRANLLGIPVGRLSTMVWAIAALLSAVAVIFRTSIFGFVSFSSVSGGGPSFLLRTFAAAVIARMDSLVAAAVAAIALGVFEITTLWTFSNATYSDALLVFVILAALFVQKGRFDRAKESGIATWKAMREVRPIPAELRRLPEVRFGLLGMWAVLGAVVLGFPLIAAPHQEQLAALVFITAIVAVSLVVLTGWVGQISLGQWALVGFGAAATGVLVGRHGLDLWIALPAGMAFAAGVALLIGLPALRVRGPFLAVTTLAFAVTSFTFFLEDRYFPWIIEGRLERPALWNRLSIADHWQFYFFSLAMLMLTILAARNLRRSRTGRALIAIRDNEPNAQAMSLDTTRLKLLAFAISGAIAGLAGGLFVLHQHGLATDSFGPEVSIRLFSMVVIGGLGSIPGAILGAVYVRSAEFFLGGGWALLASGIGIVLLLLLLPGGLGSGIYRLRDEMLRWVAKRRGLIVPSLLADVRQEDHETAEAADMLSSVLGNGNGRTTNGSSATSDGRRREEAKT